MVLNITFLWLFTKRAPVMGRSMWVEDLFGTSVNEWLFKVLLFWWVLKYYFRCTHLISSGCGWPLKVTRLIGEGHKHDWVGGGVGFRWNIFLNYFKYSGLMGTWLVSVTIDECVRGTDKMTQRCGCRKFKCSFFSRFWVNGYLNDSDWRHKVACHFSAKSFISVVDMLSCGNSIPCLFEIWPTHAHLYFSFIIHFHFCHEFMDIFHLNL